LFHLEIESDLSDAEDSITLEHTAATIADLLNWLPMAAINIASRSGMDVDLATLPVYASTVTGSDAELRDLLAEAFEWEILLSLGLWGQLHDLQSAYERFIVSPARLTHELAAWLIASAAARALLPGFVAAGINAPAPMMVAQDFTGVSLAGVIIARALAQANEPADAVGLLEATVAQHPSSVIGWLSLATLYRQSGDFANAVETCQRAIEQDAINAPLLINYAQILPWMQRAGFTLDEFILIEPDDYHGDYPIWEAVEAYELALKHAPQQPTQVLSSQALLLLDVAIQDADIVSRFWRVFEAVVQQDSDGEFTRLLVDNLHSIEMIEPGFTILEDAVEQHPHRPDLHINLAIAYLAGGENEYAAEELEEARRLSDAEAVHADVARLLLAASDSEFDAIIGDITDRVSAGTTLAEEDIAYLESALERAPQYAELYLLLARGYLRTDPAAALETLLDAEKLMPHEPDILELLGQVLWSNGEAASALGYVQRGVDANPVYVPLLALLGQLLFEDQQYEIARVYLARADAIAPNHPRLMEARRMIAKAMGDQNGS
ncbi:MAG: tetratricopeptide repeat protein, partial [Armatimonadetes bacterium]|nr:tetratricopeptide repeat protein [Anaerolineae bacterium]